MPTPAETYLHCDILEELPAQNRENWLKELTLLEDVLPQGADVLQIGCMDGTRLLRLLTLRPDLRATGLDIEADLLEMAKGKCPQAAYVLGDITDPPALPHFRSCICLNNTLGYIAKEGAAIEHMQSLADTVIISVYGENFGNDLAREYFSVLRLSIQEIEGNIIRFNDFTSMKRYTRKEVEQWHGEIQETPLGYFCTLTS